VLTFKKKYGTLWADRAPDKTGLPPLGRSPVARHEVAQKKKRKGGKDFL